MRIKDIITKMVNPNDMAYIVVCEKKVVAKTKSATSNPIGKFEDYLDATIKGKGIKVGDGKMIFNVYKPID